MTSHPAENVSASLQCVLKVLGRTLKQPRRTCLFNGHVDAAGLGVIHFHEISQVASGIHNGQQADKKQR